MKGILKLYDSNDEMVDTVLYTNKRDRKAMMNAWAKRCMGGSGYYFIVEPFVEPKLKPTQQVYFYNLRHKPKPDVKIEIVRPAAIYSNPKSPYGIADELHKIKSNQP